MAEIEGKAVVARPVEDVFDYIVDPGFAHEWIQGVESAEAHGELGEGTEVTSTAGLLGVTFDTTATISTYERPTRYAYEGDSPFRYRLTYELHEVGDSRTEVTIRGDVDPGGFFKLGGPLLVRRLRKQALASLDQLKANLEN